MLIITYDASLGSFTKYFEKIWSRQKITKLNVLQTINFLFIKKNETISNQFEIKVRTLRISIYEPARFHKHANTTAGFLGYCMVNRNSLSLSALHATRAKKDTVL